MTPTEIAEARRVIAGPVLCISDDPVGVAGFAHWARETLSVALDALESERDGAAARIASVRAHREREYAADERREKAECERDEARAALRQAAEGLRMHNCCDRLRGALAATEKVLGQPTEEGANG